jgi:exodeoxyribonuclease V alpha subunit
MTDAAKILEVPAALITPCLDELAATERVIRESVPPSNGAETAPQVPAAYLPPFHAAERGLASALLRLLAARADRLAAFREVDWDKALASLRSRTGAPLAPEQEEAVRLALTSRVAMLTGGPGCGKSFTVRSVVALARAKGAKVVLAAPTGRAAKRLAELTGHEAATIHRLLQLRPGGEPLVRCHHTAGRRSGGGGGRDLDGGPDPGQQADQGGPAGGAPAAGRGRGPRYPRSARGRCCATCSPRARCRWSG